MDQAEGPRRSVLIADDDVIFRTVASELVRSWGYDCVTVNDGQEALQVLQRSSPPSIAILDWLMPKVAGTEVCHQIRSRKGPQYIFFILVSARGGREDSLEGLRSGADSYISKPLDAEELRAKLEIAERILRMEESLRDLNAETELFLNSVPSILIGTDIKGRITRWNHGAEYAFDLSKDSVQGKTLDKCGIFWIDDGIHGQVESVLQAGSTAHLSLSFDHHSGHRLAGLTIHPLRSHLGSIAGSVIIGADITEKKVLEDQLRQSQKLEGIGQLAAGIAHEINTPTQFVSDNVTFLKESWQSLGEALTRALAIASDKEACRDSKSMADFRALAVKLDLPYYLEEVPKALDETLEGLQRISKIVQAMKEFSHTSSRQKRHADINAAIQTTITVSRGEWRHVAELTTDLDPTLPPVPCVADQLNQAVLNIIVNAAHAITDVVGEGGSEKGQIAVRTRHDGDGVEISIADSGGGIPPEIRNRIFEPFFSTKEVGKGTGQGLALCHTVVVKEHGGRLWFESEVGRGSTFFIWLPLTVSPDEELAGLQDEV